MNITCYSFRRIINIVNLIRQRPVYQGNLKNKTEFASILRSYLAYLLHESKKKKEKKNNLYKNNRTYGVNHQQSRSRSWNQIRAWNRDSCTASIDDLHRVSAGRLAPLFSSIDRSSVEDARLEKEERKRERERYAARRRVFTSRSLMALTVWKSVKRENHTLPPLPVVSRSKKRAYGGTDARRGGK